MSNHQRDKLVNGLSDRLGKLWPIDDSNGDSDGGRHHRDSNNDGVYFWRGKKIMPSDVWLKLSKAKMNGGTVDDVLEGIQYFPDTYIKYLWVLGIPHGSEDSTASELIIRQKVYAWYSDYIELMVYRRDPEYEKYLDGKELTQAPPYCSDDFNAVGVAGWFPKPCGLIGESERRIRIRHELGF